MYPLFFKVLYEKGLIRFRECVISLKDLGIMCPRHLISNISN